MYILRGHAGAVCLRRVFGVGRCRVRGWIGCCGDLDDVFWEDV